MATKQHFVLFENVSGYSLFIVKEFDEVIRKFSAHPNSFLKPVAFVPFLSIADALENVQAINDGCVSKLLRNFLRQNMPFKDAQLGVADERLGKSILELDIGFECIWDSSIKEIMRIIRANSSRLLRSLLSQPSGVSSKLSPVIGNVVSTSAQEIVPGKKAEHRARLIVSLSRARLQLDLLHHLADSGVVRCISLVDSMDDSLTKSLKRLKAAYSLHFPEICRGNKFCLDDYAFISIIANYPSRSKLLEARHEKPSSLQQLANWTSSESVAEEILCHASTSTGEDLSGEDLLTLQQFAKFLLRLLESRRNCCGMLERRVRSLMPNLTALMDKTLPSTPIEINADNCVLDRKRCVGDHISSVFVVARLLMHAVNLDRLAKMSSSRVNSLGASKSLFRQSGAVSAASMGLLGTVTSPDCQNIIQLSAGRLRPIVVRRRITRILAAKSSLACRVDCYHRVNPFEHKMDGHDIPAVESVPHHLASGEYGASLGVEAKRQLRVWAEANGVQCDRSLEEVRDQRERRKKYRKLKRKAWLRRKVTRPNGDEAIATAPSQEGVGDKIDSAITAHKKRQMNATDLDRKDNNHEANETELFVGKQPRKSEKRKGSGNSYPIGKRTRSQSVKVTEAVS